ncbi:MAG TPA: tannase/feruloyl esterase family alpha/beta hydrolase [Bryobacteraceae bacterium]|nr:tannase/feruloyl esterase family alpha/beta hydrolase [Bryobacteraceae bacterium]
MPKLSLVASLLIALTAPTAFAATCESLASLKLSDTAVTSAAVVPAGALPEFCRVALTIRPTADSDIRMEMWLPASNWNKKFEANGNGGWAGSIQAGALAAGLKRGYATAMTDTGHEGGSAAFAMGHPEKLIDYDYRAVHEMAVKGKAIVKAFYGEDPARSYWDGCSQGGRQGLKEAQMYPSDFDGIVAGAPALNWTGRAMQSVWIAQATHKDDASFVPSAKFAAIHRAALEACDANDGVKDGVIEDPTRCHFDPQVMECKGADSPTCLTTAQVETVRKIYASVTNSRTQQEIFPGHEPGSEMGWNTMASPNPFGLGADLFKYVVFQNPEWDYKSFNFDSGVDATLKTAGQLNAMDANIKSYLSRGGKLIQYHGWGDPQISPRSSVNYYKSVLDTLGGASQVMGSYRLFMVPGMAHCRGGDGTSTFDMLTALEQWVEANKTPERIEASRIRDGKVDRTRPLCPYPQVAVYKGSGSTDESANFACQAK